MIFAIELYRWLSHGMHSWLSHSLYIYRWWQHSKFIRSKIFLLRCSPICFCPFRVDVVWDSGPGPPSLSRTCPLPVYVLPLGKLPKRLGPQTRLPNYIMTEFMFLCGEYEVDMRSPRARSCTFWCIPTTAWILKVAGIGCWSPRIMVYQKSRGKMVFQLQGTASHIMTSWSLCLAHLCGVCVC